MSVHQSRSSRGSQKQHSPSTFLQSTTHLNSIPCLSQRSRVSTWSRLLHQWNRIDGNVRYCSLAYSTINQGEAISSAPSPATRRYGSIASAMARLRKILLTVAFALSNETDCSVAHPGAAENWATGCKVRQRTVTPPGKPTLGSIPRSPTTHSLHCRSCNRAVLTHGFHDPAGSLNRRIATSKSGSQSAKFRLQAK